MNVRLGLKLEQKKNHGQKISSRSYSFFFSLSSSLSVSALASSSSIKRRASDIAGASGMTCGTPVMPQTGFKGSLTGAPHRWHFATWRTPGRRWQNGMSGRSQHACSVDVRLNGDDGTDWLECMSHDPLPGEA